MKIKNVQMMLCIVSRCVTITYQQSTKETHVETQQ